MSQIILEVNEKHLNDVLLILKSLKTGMITSLHCNNKTSHIKKSKELNASSNNYITQKNAPLTSRYLSPKAFKQKLYKEKI